MLRHIITNPDRAKEDISGSTEFVIMMNGCSKQVLTMLLKEYTLLIELKNKRLIVATYRGYYLVAETDPYTILVLNENNGKEEVITISDIQIVRVCR